MWKMNSFVQVFLPILITLTKICHGLYGSDSDVVDLTPSNFNSKVIQSDEIWVVEFFAPWCGHCQSLAPEYSKAATALKGVVNVGAIDVDKHQSLGGQYGVKGFPTIKIFGANKNSPQDYNGPRVASGIIDSAFKELRKIVDRRLGGGKSSGGSGGEKTADSKDVIELTDSNFADTVLKSDDMWLVEFYAPWCGHCKNLAPHWAKAATELKGKVKLGALDATEHTVISNKYGVKGFPTIKFFPAGKKDGSAEEYDGGRTSADIVSWALDKFAENAPPPEVKQLINNDALKDACENHPLCVISILPHILDCQSACRNQFLETLSRLGEKFKRNSWGWIWAEALVQPELENALEIGGFGYPAMAIVNIRKMKYSLLRGSFSYDGINEFLREVSVGRGASAPVKGAKLPDIHETEPWDGKDGELPVEEEIDLSDIDLDEEPAKKHTEL